MLKIVVNFCPFLKENDKEKYKSEGARKSIVLFAAQGVEENYFNIQKAIAEIELDKIEFKLACDLKCLSLVIGIQSQSSRHPCPYCKASYDSKNGIWSKSRGERTFGDNLLNCSKWMDKAGCKLDKSKDYYNCVHPPMITGTRIIEKCPCAPLHVCKLGPFNHIIENLAMISPDPVENL